MIKKIQNIEIVNLILFLIFGYLMGLLSWQIIHPGLDLQDYFTNNILPPTGHFFTGLSFLIIISIILSLIGYLLNLKSRNLNTKTLLLLILLQVIAINFQSIASLGIFKINIFSINLYSFLSYGWFFQNLIFCFIASFFTYNIFFTLINVKIKSDKKLIIFLILFGSVFYSFLTIVRHLNFGSHAMDLGGYDQTIWGFSKLKMIHDTIYMRSFNDLGDHFEPILLFLTPFYWIWNNVIMLLIIQAVAVSLGVIPIFLLAKKILKSSFASCCLSLSYILFIGLQSAVLFDFHPLVLLVPVLAFMIYFLETNQDKRYYFIMFFALLFKESIAVYFLFIGLYAILRKKYKIGLITILTGIIWYILTIKILIPWISGAPYVYLDMFNNLGNNPIQIAKTILFNPVHTIYLLFNPGIKIETILGIFTSSGLLALFSPVTLVLTMPMMMEKFLSGRSMNWIMGFHYTATITPMVIFSVMYGIRNIQNKFASHKLINFLSLFVIFCTLSVAVFYYRDSAPISIIKYFRDRNTIQSENIKSLNKLITLIPKDASVKAQDSISPHLTHREKIYKLDNQGIEADYIIMDSEIDTWPYSSDDIKNLVSSYKKQGYQVISENNAYLLIKQ